MSERPEKFNPAGQDPEATLVTPRFDEAEARRAHPVVPLADAPAHTSYVSAHAPRRRTRRRSWMPALLAVALLAVAAVGGAVATRYMQGPRAGRLPEQTQQEQTQAPPVQAAAAQQTVTPPAAEPPREDAPAARPTPRRARTRRERAAPAPMRYEAGGYSDEDGELREIREEVRREREKEMRKASKRAQKNAPRLVDVLTRP